MTMNKTMTTLTTLFLLIPLALGCGRVPSPNRPAQAEEKAPTQGTTKSAEAAPKTATTPVASNEGTSAAPRTPGLPRVHRAVVILVDDTASFGHFRQALQATGVVINSEARPGDLVRVRLISKRSFEQGDYVPLFYVPFSTHAIDKARAAQLMAARQKVLGALKDRLSHLAKSTERGTDVLTSLRRAADLLAGQEARGKLLLACTDGGETENRAADLPPGSLRGVEVKFLFWATNAGVEETQKRQQRFTDLLQAAGARSVSFLDEEATVALVDNHLVLTATP
jgi:hypothetical protein